MLYKPLLAFLGHQAVPFTPAINHLLRSSGHNSKRQAAVQAKFYKPYINDDN